MFTHSLAFYQVRYELTTSAKELDACEEIYNQRRKFMLNLFQTIDKLAKG